MITFQLIPGDIEKVRFAYSPLIEVSMSFRRLRYRELQTGYQHWLDETRRAFERIEFPYLNAAILPDAYIVDFLTPTPTKAVTSFEDEIERMRQTPDEVIRKNIRTAIHLDGDSPIRREFLEHPREALECLIAEVRFYWQQALEPHWAQLASILERDVLFRARALALDGIDAMFADLTKYLEYHQGVIRITKDCPLHPSDAPLFYQLNGEGLQLVPSIFAPSGGLSQAAPEWLPMLIYQTRGLGLWRHNSASEPTEALQLTLGASRARLLQALIEPSHTSDLAQRLDLTAGAVSQQLGRLIQAGLLELYRSGSKVYYRLSMRGEHLLDVFNE